jgi:GNAT superfamily N-acetyltransferase
MSVTVRRATPADVPEILRMIHALATYEHQPEAVEATEESLTAILFGDDPKLFAQIAELEGRAAGIAVWFLNFSTWTGRHGIYLEDLFVDPEVRRVGVARALFGALAREAKRRGCARIDWACSTGTNWRWISIAGSAGSGARAGSHGGWRVTRWSGWRKVSSG